MHHRRRTLAYTLAKPLPRASLPALPLQSCASPCAFADQACLEQQAVAKVTSLLNQLDRAFLNLHQLEQLAEQPHTLSPCEVEPPSSTQAARPSEPIQPPPAPKREPSARAKPKTQSCDMSEWRRERAKQNAIGGQGLVSLIGRESRASESEDRSEEIQSLLRRKKELRLESKPVRRLPSEGSKTILGDRKQKKWFVQDDEGQVFELASTLKQARDSAPMLKLGNIKVLPGQQLSLKRRPIIEMPTRKTKRRKEVGDTCVLIEQLYDQEHLPNQDELIQQVCGERHGVRIAPRDKPIPSILRLPALR